LSFLARVVDAGHLGGLLANLGVIAPVVVLPDGAQHDRRRQVAVERLVDILRRFEERGLVEQAYRTLRVVDAAGLKEIAEGRQR
jgi:hypothetical protein